MEKKCNKCNVVKDVSEFHKNKRHKDGLKHLCKSCRSLYHKVNKDKAKEYYQANKEKINDKNKKYREDNKEKIAAKTKEYRENNREKLKQSSKQHYESNKENLREKLKEYRDANKDKAKEYRENNKERIIKYREDNKEKAKRRYQDNKEKINNYVVNYHKSKIKTDSLFRLKWSTRTNIYRYLKDGKSKRTREIIGIDYKEFQDYLEVEYTDGMHLDHIIPLSWSINDEEVYTLNHYSNFQIITAEENLTKSDRYCKSENLKKVLDNHNDLTKLNKIIERNSDKIK